MATVIETGGLPFVVEPVAPYRVQMWAWFAGHASTKETFDVVSDAFGAFWFEVSASDRFRWTVEELRAGNLTAALNWLDSLVWLQQTVGEYWGRVVNSLQGFSPEQQGQYAQWFSDAQAHWQQAQQVKAQAAQQVAMICTQQQWELPQNTQGFFAERQAG